MRKWLFPTLFAIIILTVGFANLTGTGDGPVARSGILDLREWDFNRDGPAKLDGEWDFYWKELHDRRPGWASRPYQNR